jgi:MazG family protein
MTTPVSNMWEHQSPTEHTQFLFLFLPAGDTQVQEQRWGELFQQGERPLHSTNEHLTVRPAIFHPALWPESAERHALHLNELLAPATCEPELLAAANNALQTGTHAVLDLRNWMDTTENLERATLRVAHLTKTLPGTVLCLLLSTTQRGSKTPSDGTQTDGADDLLACFPDPAHSRLARSYVQESNTSSQEGSLGTLDLAPFIMRTLRDRMGFHLPNLEVLQSEAIRLARIISRLRAPNGCPWDREQTISSLRPYLIEEAYEAFEAASDWSDGDPSAAAALCDELGDVLLQIVLNAQIAAEGNHFTLNDVFKMISEKMVRRHPHVFDEESSQLGSAEEVRNQWDQIKSAEKVTPHLISSSKAPEKAHKSLLHKAEKKKSLPTLEYLTAISKRSTRLGFCWTELKDIWQDIVNEVKELEEELHAPSVNWPAVSDELGDVVLALANVIVHGREKMAAPEDFTFDAAVRRATSKFVNRFKEMEAIYAEEEGQELNESQALNLDLQRWDDLWKKAKKRRYR